MRNIASILLISAGAVFGIAQTQQLIIEYSNGTTETKEVQDIKKLSFRTIESQTPSEPDDPVKPDDPVVDPDNKMVDMGLSVKWAAWNVGATAPEQYGDFFAYGEIEPKTEYTFDTYKWVVDDYLDELAEWEWYLKLGANMSGTNYDVAHVNWGEKWRMPSTEEWEELFNNCTKEWISYNGVDGAKFTSNITGNSIFIPAAGNKYNGEYDHEGTNCMYWSPEEFDYFNPNDWDNECRNYRIDISPTYSNADGYDYPYVGFPIRPVYGDLPEQPLPQVKVPAASEAIDLGLPSGTKWAPYNIGAETESSSGLYLCYGELSQKYYAHTYNYKYYDPLTGKCEYFGEIQGTDKDAAHMLWGDGWVMPTKDQLQELLDNCTWTANGSYGYRVTGPNGNSIYLPCFDFTSYIGINYQTPRELRIPSSTESGNPADPDSKFGMIYGLVAQNGTNFMTTTTPTLRSWFSKEAGYQIRAVRK